VAPRLSGFLVELVADEEEQLGRLPDHVIHEIRQDEGGKHDCDDACDPHGARRSRKFSSCPPSAAANASDEVLAYFRHGFREAGCAMLPPNGLTTSQRGARPHFLSLCDSYR